MSFNAVVQLSDPGFQVLMAVVCGTNVLSAWNPRLNIELCAVVLVDDNNLHNFKLVSRLKY